MIKIINSLKIYFNLLFKELNLFFPKMTTQQSNIQTFNLNNRVQIFDQIYVRDSIKMLNNSFISFNQNGKILFTDVDENRKETTMDLNTIFANNILQIFQNTTLPSVTLSGFIGLINTSGESEIYNVSKNTVNIRFDPELINDLLKSQLDKAKSVLKKLFGNDTLILPAGTSTTPSYGSGKVPAYKGVIKIDANFNNNNGKNIAYNTYLVDSENLMYALYNVQYIKMRDVLIENCYVSNNFINHGNFKSYKPILFESLDDKNNIEIDPDSGITISSQSNNLSSSILLDSNKNSIYIRNIFDYNLTNETAISSNTIYTTNILTKQQFKYFNAEVNDNYTLNILCNHENNMKNYDFLIKLNSDIVKNEFDISCNHPEYIFELKIDNDNDFIILTPDNFTKLIGDENFKNKYFRIVIIISNDPYYMPDVKSHSHLEVTFSDLSYLHTLKKITNSNSSSTDFILDFISLNNDYSDNQDKNDEITFHVTDRVIDKRILDNESKFDI